MLKQTQASFDLGLGDGASLKAQLDADLEERKKKLMSMGRASPGTYGDGLLASAAMNIFGTH